MKCGPLVRGNLRVSLLALVVVAAAVVTGPFSPAGAAGTPARPGRIKVAPGPQPGTYALTWASAAPQAGNVFDVQTKSSSAAPWTYLVIGTASIGQTFAPTGGPGPYSLRVRLRDTTNSRQSMWSPTLTLFGKWATFQYSALRGGVTRDPAISATTAPRLKVKWKKLIAPQKRLYASSVVAFNSQLNKPLVYSASFGGTITATDLATGAVVWTSAGNGQIEATPAIDGNSLYVGTLAHRLLALDATTGDLQCKFSLSGAVISSPVVGHVDNTGPVVVFGDAGASEALNAGHEWAVNGVGNTNGSCTQKWVFNGWRDKGTNDERTGVWAPASLTTDTTGRPLAIFGSADPDSAVYALDARTGHLVWRFQTKIRGGDQDVGAAPTIGRPGVNGLAHGAVYINGKNAIEYAIDLLKGTKIWQFDLKTGAGGLGANSQSTAALVGNRVVVPYSRYVFSLNAATGAQAWRSAPAANIFFSSPSVSGPSGDQVVMLGDYAGVEHGYRAKNGKAVFQLKTGGPIFASAAVGFGSVLFGSSDGYLYALG